MNQESINRLVGSGVAAIGPWAKGVEGASRTRGSVVLASDSGLVLRAVERDLVLVTDHAAPRPRGSQTVIRSAQVLNDALFGTWRGLDVVLGDPLTFEAGFQSYRYVIVADSYGEFEVYQVPRAISFSPPPSWPLRPRGARLMDYDEDWLWVATAVVTLLSPLSGEIRLGVVDPSGLYALFHDEGELHVAEFDENILALTVVAIGGLEVWDFSVNETDTQIVLELSSSSRQFSVFIAELRDDRIEVFQCPDLLVQRK